MNTFGCHIDKTLVIGWFVVRSIKYKRTLKFRIQSFLNFQKSEERKRNKKRKKYERKLLKKWLKQESAEGLKN